MFNFNIFKKNNNFDKFKYFKDNYKLIETLKTSNKIDVYKVKNKKTKNIVILKILSLHNEVNYITITNTIIDLKYEYLMLKNINHPNIVKPLEFIDNFGIQLQYIQSYELFLYITNNWLQLEDKIKILNKLIDIIQYLHSISIYHLDLKLENILINNEKEPFLIDFGHSTKDKETTKLGTYVYLVPEFQEKDKMNSSKIDSWCLGLIILSFIDKTLFFNWLNNEKNKINYNKIKEKLIKTHIFIELLEVLWCWDINERKNISSLCKLDYV